MTEHIEGSGWTVNEEAAQLHAHGIDLETNQGKYTEAHQAFGSALEIIHSSGELTEDADIQVARIYRDDAFMSLREGVSADGDSSETYFNRALSGLNKSLDITKGLLPDDISRIATMPRQIELLSEHGAALALLGRMVVARQVQLNQLPANQLSDLAEIRAEQHYFGKREAHKYLRAGSNMYYLVSNAMHGARAERLNGKPAHMVPWLGRAAAGMVRAAAQDRRSFPHAFGTAARIAVSLRSKKAAAKSVLARP